MKKYKKIEKSLPKKKKIKKVRQIKDVKNTTVLNNEDLHRTVKSKSKSTSIFQDNKNLTSSERVSTELYQNGERILDKDMPEQLRKTFENIRRREVKSVEEEDVKNDNRINNNSKLNLNKQSSVHSSNSRKQILGSGTPVINNLKINSGSNAKLGDVGVNASSNNKTKNSPSKSSENGASDSQNNAKDENSTYVSPSTPSSSKLDLSDRETVKQMLSGRGKGLGNAKKSKSNNENAPIIDNEKQRKNDSNKDDTEKEFNDSKKDKTKENDMFLAAAMLGSLGNNNDNSNNNSTPGNKAQSLNVSPRLNTQRFGGNKTSKNSSVQEQTRTQSPSPSRRFGGGKNINGGTTAAAREAAKLAAQKMMKTKTAVAVGSLIAAIVVPLIIVLLLVGALSFIMNMPGTVRDKLENAAIELFDRMYGLIAGQDLPTEKQVIDYATYLETMGFDLKYNGFVTQLEKDDKGNVKELNSKYITAYLAAEQRSFMIANQNMNMLKVWENSKALFGGDFSRITDSWGTGMIVLENELTTKVLIDMGKEAVDEICNVATSVWDFFAGNKKESRPANELKNLSAIYQHIIINRDTKEMIISKQDLYDLKKLRQGYDTYSYSLKEWTEKYGTPMELFLTLHLATRAPEFVYQFATKYDTKVYINIKELTDVQLDMVYAETDSKGNVKLDKEGKPIMRTLAELGDEKLAKMGISSEALSAMKDLSGRNIEAFTPYITKVINHWYYKEIIYQGTYETSDKKTHEVDVYEERPLKAGSDGYVRYYLYTHSSDKDKTVIEESVEGVDEELSLNVLGIGNLIRAFTGDVFSGSFNGITGLADYATGGLLTETNAKLSKAINDLIPQGVKDVLSSDLAKALSNAKFFSSGFDLSTLKNVSIGDVAKVANCDGILREMKIDALGINMGSMISSLDVGDVGELASSIDDIDLSNLGDKFADGVDDFLDFTKTSIDNLTNELINGFEGTLKDIEASITQTCDELFDAFDEEHLTQVMNDLVGGISKELVNISTGEFLKDLEKPLKDVLAGKYNEQIKYALKNEASKQLLGMSADKVEKIVKMDINAVKNIGTELGSIKNSLSDFDVNMKNLSNTANKVSKELTGVDVSTLKAASTQIQNLATNTVKTISEIDDMEKLVDTGIHLGTENSAQLKSILSEQKQLYKELKEANDNLNVERAKVIGSSIKQNADKIEAFSEYLYGVDDFEAKLLKSQVNKLKSSNSAVATIIDKMNPSTITNAKNRIQNMNSQKFIQLADDFYNIDPLLSGLKSNTTLFNNALENLTTDELSKSLTDVTRYENVMNLAVNRVENYLINSTSKELRNTYSKVLSTVNLLESSTGNLNINKVAQIAEHVSDLKCSEIANFASKIIDSPDYAVDMLMNKAETFAEQKFQSVVDQLETSIVNGVKEKIAGNLSEKLTNKLLGNNNFKKSMEANMMKSNKSDPNAISGEEEQEIHDPIIEYLTGFYVREIRKRDYFQVAEPIRVLYDASEHWYPMFRENKYVILENTNIDMNKIADKDYIEKYGRTLWNALSGDIATPIYAMLQGITSESSEYLLRYFKELFTDNSWVFDANYNFMQSPKLDAVKFETFGWIFQTKRVTEIINTKTQTGHSALKAEYEPANWTSSKVGILTPYSKDNIYGFKPDVPIVSPVKGVIVGVTEATTNELGENVPATVTIEARNTGDENADGMRVILVGGKYDYARVGMEVNKAEVEEFIDSNEPISSNQASKISMLGVTTDEPIKVMVLDKDRTMVSDVSKFVRPPYEEENDSIIKNGV